MLQPLARRPDVAYGAMSPSQQSSSWVWKYGSRGPVNPVTALPLPNFKDLHGGVGIGPQVGCCHTEGSGPQTEFGLWTNRPDHSSSLQGEKVGHYCSRGAFNAKLKA